MAAPRKSKSTKEVVNPEVIVDVQDVGETPQQAAEPAKADQALYTHEMTLSIYETRVFPVVPGTGRIVVENLAGGDAFVSETARTFSEESRIAPGEAREIVGASVVYLSTASRPRLRISMFQ
ncbi:hypothetical protein ACP26L_36400 (plasmid) [Paenibacillus sp. S-38]|uniref:hypothetical protein n=1 Tax=Paenibacillus sp. S-38 TaxID=3416710 RepID=UPI003CE80FB2